MGADKTLKCSSGYNALHWAAMNGQLECCKVLIEGAAKTFLNEEYGLGKTALDLAKLYKRQKVVELLT